MDLKDEKVGPFEVNALDKYKVEPRAAGSGDFSIGSQVWPGASATEGPMSRPSFNDIYLRLATMMSERSTCRRLKVGCAIVTPDFRKVLAVGYNGNAAGCNNDCDLIGDEAVGNCGCLHAEENAVINCDSPRATEKTVFCTHLPCVMCAKRLINLGGVRKVYYRNNYRIQIALNLLDRVGIAHEYTPEEGMAEKSPCSRK